MKRTSSSEEEPDGEADGDFDQAFGGGESRAVARTRARITGKLEETTIAESTRKLDQDSVQAGRMSDLNLAQRERKRTHPTTITTKGEVVRLNLP